MRVKTHATPYGVLTSITTTDEDGRSIIVYSNIHEDTVLERSGMRNDGTFGVIDDLSVNYDGNRLLKVTDDAESLNYNGALDFNDGADMTAEYEYDSTGALTKDRNRGITGITYDLSHNPQTIVMNGGQIVNDYTSDGRKLCSTQSTGMTTTTDMYVDGLIIRNGAPLMWQFDGGYVSLGTNSVPQSWNYYITDHLGSTRMVVDSQNNIKETINYYPYGSEMTMTSPAQLTSNPNWQPYRFTGKELVRQSGLNMYDFGARWYDVAGVPVWTSMDPLCEKNYPVTPYSYCNGDPVNAIDPDGKEVRDGLGAYSKKNSRLKAFARRLAKNNDPNSIMIVAHGVYDNENSRYASYINIKAYNPIKKEWKDYNIENGKQLSNFLSANSKTWQNYKKGNISSEDLHIVFYSCGASAVAKEISKDEAFKDVTFIAPENTLSVKPDAFTTSIAKEDSEKGSSDDEGGQWHSFKNGDDTKLNYDENEKPGTKGFKYE